MAAAVLWAAMLVQSGVAAPPPVMPACAVGRGWTMVRSLGALPPAARTALVAGLASRGLADAGERYQTGDVGSVPPLPRARFIRAYGMGDRWIAWVERGGIAHGFQTIAVQRVAGEAGAYRVVPGSVMHGDLCAATRQLAGGRGKLT